jgi:hypothetical protein
VTNNGAGKSDASNLTKSIPLRLYNNQNNISPVEHNFKLPPRSGWELRYSELLPACSGKYFFL